MQRIPALQFVPTILIQVIQSDLVANPANLINAQQSLSKDIERD